MATVRGTAPRRASMTAWCQASGRAIRMLKLRILVVGADPDLATARGAGENRPM